MHDFALILSDAEWSTERKEVLDLEGDAAHRGSSFGGLGRAPQPTNEHYENRLAVRWRSFDPAAPVRP